MPRIKYVGPHDGVEVPSLGLTFTRGEPVEVDADAAKSLLDQPDNYKSAGADKPAKENDK